VALPDADFGQRLASTAADREALRNQARGANPLLSRTASLAEGWLGACPVVDALTAHTPKYLIDLR
jgi:hypothetical protein